ncbi:MAG: YidC/Oxa1 family membrane protein insertase, partial [Clostridia bacterium]|nr:YidC/Oxa1 family membrane protein insertase [Clostridia bacterium]
MQGIFALIATPFGYVMRFMYDIIGNYGVCIILFSLFVKIVTSPLTLKQKRSMQATQRLQPKIQAIQKKYYNDKQKMNEELTALYERENASPTAGCGTMIITLVIMLGLYYVISQPLTYFRQLSADEITAIAEILGVDMRAGGYGSQIVLAGKMFNNYDLIKHVSDNVMHVDFNFLGIDLAANPAFKKLNVLWVMPIVSGLTALGQSFVTTKLQQRHLGDNPAAAQSNKMMYIMMPLMSLYFGFVLPAGLSLYWISNNVFGAASEVVFTKILAKE